MGTFYGPSPRPDELYHWRYKKKYRGKSGKWIYVYQDGSMSENGSFSEKRKYTTQNGTPLYEKTTYKTNTNNWLNSTTQKTSVSTDGKKAKMSDEKTIEYGKLHVLKHKFTRAVGTPSTDDKVEGAKWLAKSLAKSVPKAAKAIKKTAPKVYKATKKGIKKAFDFGVKYSQRKAFNK